MDLCFDPTSAQFRCAQHAANAAVDGVLERRLAAMRNGSHRVCTPGVSSEDIALRFASCEVPAAGCSPERYLRALERKGLHDEMMLQSPLMLGHMSGAIPPWAAPLGRLVHAMHTNVVKTETAKVATAVERETVAMLHRLLFRRDAAFYAQHAQDKAVCLGHATSGGTTANLEALWLARNTALPLAESRGLSAALREGGWSDAVVVASELAHYSVSAKACGLLGIGTDNVLSVPTDERLRVDLRELRLVLERCREQRRRVLCLVAVCGSTDAGSFDDLAAMAALAQLFGVWLHVDAAWGGGLVFGSGAHELLRGVELADSVALDAHKQMLSPLGLGLLLFRSESAVLPNCKSASYIIRPESHDLGRFTLEGSRPASAYFLHMNLHVLGLAGLRSLVDRKLALAQALAREVERSCDFELCVRPEADILLLRLVPPPLRALRQAARERASALLAAHAEALPLAEAMAEAEAAEAGLDELQVRLHEALKLRGRSFVSRTALPRPCWQPGGPRRRTAFLRVVLNAQSHLAGAAEVLDDLRLALRLLPPHGPAGCPAPGGGEPLQLQPEQPPPPEQRQAEAEPGAEPACSLCPESPRSWPEAEPRSLAAESCSQHFMVAGIMVACPLPN